MTGFGTVRRDGGWGAVRFQRRYATTPEDLWDAWTSPERLARWMGATVTGPVVPGGSVILAWGPEPEARVRVDVDELRPPELLEWRWTVHGAAPSVLRVELRPSSGGTLLVLDHSMLPPDQTAGTSAGWHNHLDALASGTGAGDWWPRYVEDYRERLAAL